MKRVIYLLIIGFAFATFQITTVAAQDPNNPPLVNDPNMPPGAVPPGTMPPVTDDPNMPPGTMPP
ncbi:MAG: hypothetical protein VX429_01540, partial [Nitrospinota bacterium]|nr:hypothetical protein [Nitrospinota bacterium]